jgi:predicted subunit of tRNA(5-methylaminomethyl-2-thiouridylate) methyltransferase
MAGKRGYQTKHQTEGRKVSAKTKKKGGALSQASRAALADSVAEETCDKPAALMARHGHQGEFVPVCLEHADAAVERTADAGKQKMSKEAAGANRDDRLPLHRRALTAVETEMNLRCLNHLLGAQINA